MGKLGIPKGVDISDADAGVSDVKDPKTFYAGAEPKKTGTMPTVAIVAGSGAYPAGYHVGDGGGLVAIDADLVVAKIKKDVVIFGVTGTFENTIATTELDKVIGAVQSIETTWETLIGLTAEAPANALRIEATVGSSLPSGAINGDIRITYNSVEKIVQSLTANESARIATWEGIGLGSAVQVEAQAKMDSGSVSLNYCGVFYYQTLT